MGTDYPLFNHSSISDLYDKKQYKYYQMKDIQEISCFRRHCFCRYRVLYLR